MQNASGVTRFVEDMVVAHVGFWRGSIPHNQKHLRTFLDTGCHQWRNAGGPPAFLPALPVACANWEQAGRELSGFRPKGSQQARPGRGVRLGPITWLCRPSGGPGRVYRPRSAALRPLSPGRCRCGSQKSGTRAAQRARSPSTSMRTRTGKKVTWGGVLVRALWLARFLRS
jgi:hypothetical protein